MPTLASLKPGESAFVTLLDEGSYTCKLLNLGILPKTKVTMVRKSPFGGAFYIKLERHQLAMRTEEAETIYIEQKQ
ncbi:MAG: ferrous iron transport protein A [Saprospiraceae bacterium]|jgi:Fe2+ transport system protein FeoA|nr:ferrous iron transport protein A [Saprospiraceae bacterium]MBP6237675.1 ferrous iron transport protein A [Saprospiraceae bacterium]MBP6568384.1 ferrous iron transport protein A [Saprospiraceae bacterium]